MGAVSNSTCTDTVTVNSKALVKIYTFLEELFYLLVLSVRSTAWTHFALFDSEEISSFDKKFILAVLWCKQVTPSETLCKTLRVRWNHSQVLEEFLEFSAETDRKWIPWIKVLKHTHATQTVWSKRLRVEPYALTDAGTASRCYAAA